MRFYLKAWEKEFIVSKPFGDLSPYDFIVDFSGRLCRVQVKSTFSKDEHGYGYRVQSSCGTKSKIPYSEQDVDFLVCYVEPEDVWYIIPVTDCGVTTINLYPHIQNSKGRFEKYREAWILLH